MSVYLLYTSTIRAPPGDPAGPAARHIARVGHRKVCTSVIVAAELRFGCAKKGSAKLSLNGILVYAAPTSQKLKLNAKSATTFRVNFQNGVLGVFRKQGATWAPVMQRSLGSSNAFDARRLSLTASAAASFSGVGPCS